MNFIRWFWSFGHWKLCHVELERNGHKIDLECWYKEWEPQERKSFIDLVEELRSEGWMLFRSYGPFINYYDKKQASVDFYLKMKDM